jgi:hypothetical protein
VVQRRFSFPKEVGIFAEETPWPFSPRKRGQVSAEMALRVRRRERERRSFILVFYCFRRDWRTPFLRTRSGRARAKR